MAAAAAAAAAAVHTPLDPNVAFGFEYAKALAIANKEAKAALNRAALRSAVRSIVALAASPSAQVTRAAAHTTTTDPSDEMADLAYRRFLRFWDAATPEERKTVADAKEGMAKARACVPTAQELANSWRCAGCQTLSVSGEEALPCSEVLSATEPDSEEDSDHHPHKWACDAMYCTALCRDDHALLHLPDCHTGAYGHTLQCTRLKRRNDKLDAEVARRAADGVVGKTDARSLRAFQQRVDRRAMFAYALGEDLAVQEFLLAATKKDAEAGAETAAVGGKRSAKADADVGPAAKKARA